MFESTFWKHHLLWPLLLLSAAVFAIETTQFDLIFDDWLFKLEGQHWALRNNFITQILLHDAAQNFSKILALLLLIVALISPYNQYLRRYQKGWWLLFASITTASILVNIGKSFTHVDCPWDLLRYGGDRPYISIFQIHPGNFAFGQCFPAGHSSGGYGFLALYFFFRHYQPQQRWTGLLIGILMGLVYGFDQQLRGAHFLSHDVWTLSICWFTALFYYWLLLRRQSIDFLRPLES